MVRPRRLSGQTQNHSPLHATRMVGTVGAVVIVRLDLDPAASRLSRYARAAPLREASV
jgi:hypothetical protein